jgi:hypothetical protein
MTLKHNPYEFLPRAAADGDSGIRLTKSEGSNNDDIMNSGGPLSPYPGATSA